MKFAKILFPLAALLFLGVAYRSYGWGGVVVALGALVMYLLLHFTRAMQVLKRAADRPIGYVGSAVMLNAKLKPKVTLLHVVAMTRALGEQRTPKEEQPEVFRWTDAGGSWVDATFVNGKLSEWHLVRPDPSDSKDLTQGADAAAAGDDGAPAAGTPSADAVRPGTADALRPPV